MTKTAVLSQMPLMALPSQRYQQLFNNVSAELGLGITYLGSQTGNYPNDPQVRSGDIEANQSVWEHYGITEARPRSNPLLDRDVRRVRETIEKRRLEAVEKGFNAFPIVKSKSLSEENLALLNPAERAWAESVGPVLYRFTQELYGIQSMPQSAMMTRWMKEHADAKSLFHYDRMRTPIVPMVTGDLAPYASSVPWMPDSPTYSMMWPADMTAEELAYVRERSDENDPIRLPYTRVSRIDKHEAERIEAGSLPRSKRIQTEWAREGLDGRWYRVQNIAHDVEMRPLLLSIAETLREHADIEVDGAVLHPEFRAYSLTVADALTEGDWETLLKADLEQTEGNLYFTFFPHEGYWSDNIKFPISLEIGIRDSSLMAALEKYRPAFEWLSGRIADVVRDSGMSTYFSPPSNIDFRRDFVSMWPTRTGGFMRGYTRDPFGHDYPKVKYPGIEMHRVVTFLDTVHGVLPGLKGVAEKLFGDEMADYITLAGRALCTLVHEATHGIQIRPGDKTLSGKEFGEAFGRHWGVVVEPWADAGSMVAAMKLFGDGRIEERESFELVFSRFVQTVNMLLPRERSMSEGVMKSAPHMTGAAMLTGYAYRFGALGEGSKHLLEVDREKLAQAMTSFLDEVTRYAARGDVKAYLEWVKDCIEALPLELEQKILKIKEGGSAYVIVDRGELKLPEEIRGRSRVQK